MQEVLGGMGVEDSPAPHSINTTKCATHVKLVMGVALYIIINDRMWHHANRSSINNRLFSSDALTIHILCHASYYHRHKHQMAGE